MSGHWRKVGERGVPAALADALEAFVSGAELTCELPADTAGQAVLGPAPAPAPHLYVDTDTSAYWLRTYAPTQLGVRPFWISSVNVKRARWCDTCDGVRWEGHECGA